MIKPGIMIGWGTLTLAKPGIMNGWGTLTLAKFFRNQPTINQCKARFTWLHLTQSRALYTRCLAQKTSIIKSAQSHLVQSFKILQSLHRGCKLIQEQSSPSMPAYGGAAPICLH